MARHVVRLAHLLFAGLSLLVICEAAVQPLFAQGLLINADASHAIRLPRPPYAGHPSIAPRPPQSSYKIKELSVQVRLGEQVATTQVTQSFVNTGSAQMEVSFVFPLPYDGAIDHLTLMIDGKEHAAKLLPAAEARSVYEEIVRANRDPALLEWLGAGMFKTSVFPVPPGAERKVTLSYTQLCRKVDGLTDFLFPLSAAKYTAEPLEKFEVRVAVDSQVDIKNIYSPSHAVDIQRPDGKHAVVSYARTNEIPGADFRLLYDVGAGQIGANVLSYRPDTNDDGYFLLLATPEIKSNAADRIKKTVVFVVDRSGSMSGEKLSQAKNALKFVLNNLREGDLFNVIAYDSRIESFKPELQHFNDETRRAAIGFVEGLFAGGSTNIDGALRTALGQLRDASQPNYVLFLTDGLPTDGETNEAKIAANAKTANGVRARVMAFGVGYDVNSRLLDRLARDNFGQSEFVRPNENIESHVSSLYRRIESPVMTDATVQFEFDGVKIEEGAPTNRLYPAAPRDLFAGEQFVVAGRYKRHGAAKLVIQGRIGAQLERREFPVTFAEKSADESTAFVEKIWAARRVGEIIDQLDLSGKNDELIKELVQLSTRHGILTPYTSFLADENTNRRDLARNYDRAESRLSLLKESDGLRGVAQRSAKNLYQNADRFSGGGFSESQPGVATAKAPSSPADARQAKSMPRGGVNQNYAYFFDAETDNAVVVRSVQNLGRKTFYLRNQQWIDGSLTAEQEQKAIKIDRYGKECFDLLKKLGADAGKYLAIDEPIVVEFEGQAYSF